MNLRGAIQSAEDPGRGIRRKRRNTPLQGKYLAKSGHSSTAVAIDFIARTNPEMLVALLTKKPPAPSLKARLGHRSKASAPRRPRPARGRMSGLARASAAASAA
jgi:hypothetical protein